MLGGNAPEDLPHRRGSDDGSKDQLCLPTTDVCGVAPPGNGGSGGGGGAGGAGTSNGNMRFSQYDYDTNAVVHTFTVTP